MSPRRLVLVPRSGTPDAAGALEALARALAPMVAELLAARHQQGELVDVARHVPASRRAIYAACRAGRIAGATRVARRWLAPCASVDAWLHELGPRPVPSRTCDDGDDLEELRRSLAQPARGTRRRAS